MNVKLYDTTLRDGNQASGLSFSLDDKLAIARRLDVFGMNWIEGGWPNPSNRLDMEFFERARDLPWNSRLVAFGSTRRPDRPAGDDLLVTNLVAAQTPSVAIYGKTWALHVEQVLRTTRDMNLDMIHDTCAFLRGQGREVVYDAEHFFDGWIDDPVYALATLQAAAEGGADWIVLCDTNGGMALPWEVGQIVKQVRNALPRSALGIHTHDDSGTAVANALEAVRAGATQVHGTVNGIGERCGNCNILTMAGNLVLKMGQTSVRTDQLAGLRALSVFVSERANLASEIRAPYVGEAAFAHKGGAHIDGVVKVSRSFEHIDPAIVGNEREFVVSDQGGGALIVKRLEEIAPGLDKKDPRVTAILAEVKELEHAGWQFEVAEASFHLLAARRLGLWTEPFEVLNYRVIELMGTTLSEATIQVRHQGSVEHTAAMGDGPVDALSQALRKAVGRFFPSLERVRLTDYKVRVLDGRGGTGARVRVWVESSDGQRTWSTSGVSSNIVNASWTALADSLSWHLMREQVEGAKLER